MALRFRVSIRGDRKVSRLLKAVNPEETPSIKRDALVDAALLVQKDAANTQIVRGRGNAPPLPRQLSSRTGTLSSQITVDRRSLPNKIYVGTPLIYGRVHELGVGRFPERPYLRPALNKVSPKFPDIFLTHIKRSIARNR